MGKTILTPNQSKLLQRAATSELIVKDFYFSGGTALSEFYFKHRISEDLDFFSENPIVESRIVSWVKKSARDLDVEVTFQTLRDQQNFYFHFPKDVVKIDFAYFPFQVLGIYKKYKLLRIASIEDIAVNKLQAICTRTRGRDYFDLFIILTKGNVTFDEIQKNYRLKFDISISSEQIVKRLQAVSDAVDAPRFLGDFKWSRVEQFFLNEVKKREKKILM